MKITSLALLFLTLSSAVAENSMGDKTITKVVKLLQDMLDKSKVQGEDEKTIYAKFKCYCDQSEAEKNKAVADNTKLISLLESEIEELQGSNGELSSKSADLKAAKAQNKAQRGEAKSIRDKEHKKYIADTTDFEQAIGQMEQAIRTLTEVGADQTKSTGADNKQFMAGKGASLLSLQASMQSALSAAEAFMDKKQYQSVTSFIQAPFTGTYTSQSGAVMGIIKNMRDTFKANLAAAIAAEEAQLKSFNAYMEVKTEAYNDMSEEYDAAQEDLGDNDKTLGAKRSQLDQAEKEKANDEEFLEKLLPMCKAKGESFQERKLLRANEEVAIAQAVSILDSDEAFATFGGVSATSFLQTVNKHFPGVSDEDVREVMQRLLRRAAGGRTAPRLAAVISTLQANNPFDSVIDEIDKMVKVIGEEGKADKDKLDWCNSERKENKATLKEKNAEILKLDGKIDKLNRQIDDPEKGLKAQIEGTEQSLRENHEGQVTETAERQEANKAYQSDVKNLVAAQALLHNAIKVLKGYYDKFDSLLQSHEDPTPPTTWDQSGKGNVDGYGGQSGKGNSAITMLEFILKESKAEETDAHKEEESSQHAFEDSMTALKSEEAKSEKSLGNLQRNLATAEEDLLGAEEDLKATTKDKEATEDYLDKIRPGCDFITSTFDLRTKNRKTEKAALGKAKSTLKGSPAYKAAVAEAHVESFGKCITTADDGKLSGPCAKDEAHVKCKACQADVTIPGYCAGHKGTKGC